jgi:putative hydrolase of the HAD superfamily
MISYKPMHHIRAISFDLDDTLYDNMPYIREAERCLSKRIKKRYPLAAELSQKKWRKIRKSILEQQPELANDIGLLRATTLTKGFVEAGMPSDIIPYAVTDCYDYFYEKRSDFEVSKDIRKVLKKLSAKVPLAAITNGNVNCEAIGIAKYFTHVLHANVDLPMKPNITMFKQVSELLDMPSKNILHVGDCLKKDVEGAINAGYMSAWFAMDRKMDLNAENMSLLPHVQLSALKDLKQLIK